MTRWTLSFQAAGIIPRSLEMSDHTLHVGMRRLALGLSRGSSVRLFVHLQRTRGKLKTYTIKVTIKKHLHCNIVLSYVTKNVFFLSQL